KVNRLQQEFAENVRFLLVAKNDKRWNSGIREMYERFREKQDLQMAIAYDSVLFEQFGILSVPHIVIVDPEGVVYAVTSGQDVNQENLQALVEGKRPTFPKKASAFDDERRTIRWSGLVNEGEVRDYGYRSVFGPWKRGLHSQRLTTTIDEGVDQGCFQIQGSI